MIHTQHHFCRKAATCAVLKSFSEILVLNQKCERICFSTFMQLQIQLGVWNFGAEQNFYTRTLPQGEQQRVAGFHFVCAVRS